MLIRRPPERRMPMRSAFDWLFEDPWSDGGQFQSGSMPSIDMRETEDEFIVEAEMPGVRPEDIDVTLDGRMLVIRGEYGTKREEEQGQEKEKQGRYILQERRSGTYARAITLPSPVDADNIESSFENGELRLTLPKEAESRTRRIQIGGGSKAKQVGSGTGSSPGQESRGGEQKG